MSFVRTTRSPTDGNGGPRVIPIDGHLAAGRFIREETARLEAEWKQAVGPIPGPEIPELVIEPFGGDEKPMATRAASGKVIAQIAEQVPLLVGGSADLTPSNNTKPEGWEDFEPGAYAGRYLRFGVREHGMSAVSNGLAASGLRPYAATFFNFLDYAKPAVRLSALSFPTSPPKHGS